MPKDINKVLKGIFERLVDTTSREAFGKIQAELRASNQRSTMPIMSNGSAYMPNGYQMLSQRNYSWISSQRVDVPESYWDTISIDQRSPDQRTTQAPNMVKTCDKDCQKYNREVCPYYGNYAGLRPAGSRNETCIAFQQKKPNITPPSQKKKHEQQKKKPLKRSLEF